jgi:bifunctional DNA-binding transcriptional regulator/antitoxin component of YhaV-PrlF toxin-antitoxin module
VKTTIAEHGQVYIPAELRREMKLTPGQTVLWEKVSATECRVVIEPRRVSKRDPVAAIGFVKRHGLPVRTTAGWMKILREGGRQQMSWVVDTSVLLDIHSANAAFSHASAECLAKYCARAWSFHRSHIWS